ncbi:MAG: 2,5-dichloro-2,5-cyclohexadiene-1,4-diol dehydrogenase [Chroococcidiopsis sp. SAG 2025]|uniref:SDR family NAD(P)-dependent oxidoreductase n=1 Tax=Chroococcidiopsis sp. SAG 2025 TaxID=171389 RepID=UPI002936F8E2|nr:SDR family NAD(P)-dependent oxidoreductase [Chroococcidiopsis sp. SAG 2025]MDV2998381.1 2,5-dichloro-2,5-cyclohexadiene-1,4-diol dehydrogenase [Chroococcidiopsis sp. SAG 2025]
MTRKTNGIDRRKLIMAGGTVAGAAAIASVTHNAQATAQQPLAANTANSGRFAGKVVLITGATSGIGETTARMFAKEGAIVHFCGRREALGNKIAQEINAQGGRASYQKADVRNEQDVKSFVDTCVQKYGRIDIAFNNAGIESKPFTIAEQSLNDWMNVMTTNATGTFLSMKYELPVMLKQGGGAIVNNASVSGHVGFATIAPYSASKHAIMSLTKVAALEYADKNIRVNSISPGAVDTPMLRRALAAWKTDFDTVSKDYPIERIVQSDEIAKTVLWLSSADPTCVVGTDIDVTGGYLAK